MPRKIITILALLGLGAGLGAAPYKVQARLDRPVLAADKDAAGVVLRIQLEGLHPRPRPRPPLNLALVVDRSGSMSGDRIVQAREAARQIVDRLRPDDVFSLVSFDDKVSVDLPARRLGDPKAALAAIERLRPGGATALYAGVEAGLGQAREHAKRGRVSRLILVSDGLANVGPDKAADMRRLGREAAKHGVTVSTFGLGLGYDEDLLTTLAHASDGNHAFIEHSRDLARVLDREMGDAMALAARDLVVEIRLAPGVRLRRGLDHEVERDGEVLRLRLGRLAAGQTRQLLLELDAPAGRAGSAADLAQVRVQGHDAEGKAVPAAVQALQVRYTSDVLEADRSRDPEVTAAALKAQANAAREQAIHLRDQGRAAEAAGLLKAQATQLKAAASALPPAAAQAYGGFTQDLEREAASLSDADADWNATRKGMKERAYKSRSGQAY